MREIVCGKSRPLGRFFYCLISVLLAVTVSHASGPTMTTISDVVYRANGEAAAGTVVITWPTFTTRDNKAVAAGELSALIGPSGLLTLALAPNEGATPGGTYYKVVYKISDGTTSTEYWVVPAASPTTIAAVRATVVPTQVAAQLASKQYVDSAVTGNSDAVVHKTGTESISGVKTFSVSPTAPSPTTPTAVANKDYVDIAVGSVTGSYVRTSGDTMTGQLTLAADPVAPNQAANRHYVDIQTSTLNAGLLSKLGRLNDTPITLAAVRYADQFAGLSVGAQIDAACADLGGGNGTVVIPSTMAAGWSLAGIPSNCTMVDYRGSGGSTQTAYSRGLDFYGRYTTVGAGLQIVSPLLIEFDAYAGGVNEWPTGAATKTQWQGLRIQGNGRTIGEKKGSEINLFSQGKGDNIGLMASVNDFGGYDTGGDEGSEGGRFQTVQGDGSADGGYPRGTVASVASNTVTGAWTSGTNANLGENRPLINTSRGVYNTGTVSSVGGLPCTVVGSGTAWATLFGAGPKTDLFLNISGNDSGTTKHVIPITSITDDTHLVVEYNLAEIGPACLGATMVSSGAYKIYKGGNVASLAAPPSSSLNATGVNLSAGASNFQVGDSIQQPLGYNYHGRGIQAVVQRVIGEPQGGGFSVSNNGALPFRDGIRITGNFTNGASFDGGTLTEGLLFSEPITDALMRSNDISASVQRVINLLNGSGAQRYIHYDRGNDWWAFSGGQYFSATDARTSTSSTPQANVLNFLGWNNAAWTGLSISPSQVPNAGVPMLDVGGGAFTRFRVEANRTVVNNSSDLIGFSDNEVTQRWGVTGSTGAGRFDGGITTGAITGTNINATTGFQVSGSALNFANLAGSASAAQMPALTGDVTSTAGTTTTSVTKVNGVSYPAAPAADTIPVITAASTATYKALSDCQDTAGKHLNYMASTHSFTCGTTSSGGVINGSGTVGALAKFVTNSTTLGNSNLSDDGSTVTVTGPMARTSTQLVSEIVAPSNPAAGKAIFWNDSTTHRQGSKDSNGFTVSAPDYFDDSVFGWKDDFSVPTGTGFGEMNWSTQTFTAATFSRQSSGIPNIGVVRIATPATLNQGGALQHTSGNVGFLPNMATTTNWKMEFIFKITSASTADHQLYLGFGTVNSGTATLTTFVGCRYKTTTTESDAAFHFVAGDGAWADSGTTSVVDNTTFHKFVMYSTVAGTIQFEMDGVSKGSVSTHIPTGNYAPIILLSNGASAAVKSVDIDKVALEFTGLAR